MGARGPKPGTVKKPPDSGRKAGTLNKTTADVKALAQKHGPAAIAQLAYLMEKAEAEAARVAACREILDRAYGKATQLVAGDDTMAPIRAALTVAFRGSGSSDKGA